MVNNSVNMLTLLTTAKYQQTGIRPIFGTTIVVYNNGESEHVPLLHGPHIIPETQKAELWLLSQWIMITITMDTTNVAPYDLLHCSLLRVQIAQTSDYRKCWTQTQDVMKSPRACLLHLESLSCLKYNLKFSWFDMLGSPSISHTFSR